MLAPSGPPQVPATILPHEEDGKEEFVQSRRFDATLSGVLATIALFCATFVGIYYFWSDHRYIGAAILLGVLAAFLLLPNLIRRF
jgi:hypothetical protein